MEVFRALAKMYRFSEHGLSACVLPDSSLSCIPCNIEDIGWPDYASGTFGFIGKRCQILYYKVYSASLSDHILPDSILSCKIEYMG